MFWPSTKPNVSEIALFLGDPFLQPEMRFDDEFLLDHGSLLASSVSTKAQQARPRLSRCSAIRRAAIIFRVLVHQPPGAEPASGKIAKNRLICPCSRCQARSGVACRILKAAMAGQRMYVVQG